MLTVYRLYIAIKLYAAIKALAFHYDIIHIIFIFLIKAVLVKMVYGSIHFYF